MTEPDSRVRKQDGIWAVLPAAGIGSRMGGDIPKQYLQLQGKTVLQHSIDRMIQVSRVQGVVVAISAQDQYWPTLNAHYKLPVQTVIGGQQRMHSVFNALKYLSEELSFDGYVLVHDAARPCVRVDDINRLVETVRDHADGGLLATPLADTLKRGTDGRVQQTVARENLWQAQTPQYFPLPRLYDALQAVINQSRLVTDEAQAMEQAGFHPLLVAGHADNIKVTHRQDIQLAERYLKDQASIV